MNLIIDECLGEHEIVSISPKCSFVVLRVSAVDSLPNLILVLRFSKQNDRAARRARAADLELENNTR